MDDEENGCSTRSVASAWRSCVPKPPRRVSGASIPSADRLHARSDGSQQDDPDTDAESAPAQPAEGTDKQRQGGTGVVCFLYKDGIDTCRLLAGYLDTLAAKYPATSCQHRRRSVHPQLSGPQPAHAADYRNGELHRQIVGLRPEIGLDGMKTKCEDIELLLTAVGAIERSSVPVHPQMRTTQDQIQSTRKTRTRRMESTGSAASVMAASQRRRRSSMTNSIGTCSYRNVSSFRPP